jgi:O-6-methylguanine DNA methyltransferase
MKADRLRTFETSIGWIGLVASSKGLKAVLGPRQTLEEVRREGRETFGPLPDDHEGVLSGLADALTRYADGAKGASLEWPLDMDDGTPFQQAVWRALLTIPPGQVLTYGDVAVALGKPRGAARAVGQAVGANPFLIVVPCHRVVGSDGALTGFGGGLAVKERLLMLEGRADATRQRARTESRKTYRPSLREQGLRKKASRSRTTVDLSRTP